MAAKRETASSLSDAWKELSRLPDQLQGPAPWRRMDEDRLPGVKRSQGETVALFEFMPLRSDPPRRLG